MEQGRAEHVLASAHAVELGRLRRRNAELEVLYGTIRDLTSTLSVHEVLQRLLDRTLEHLDSEIGSIFVLENEDQLRLAVAKGLPAEVDSTVELGNGVTGYVAQSGLSLLVRDVETDPRFRRRNHERYYTHTLVSAPIVSAGRVRGVVNVNNKRSREPFRPEDLRLLEAMAGHAAVALGNAHRFEETLRRAQHDALTGLANHGHFWTTLEREVDRANRYGRSLGLVMIDVDHFKAYNDRHGHAAGDAVLTRLSRFLMRQLRAEEFVVRTGGDEFVVLLPGSDEPGTCRAATRLREAALNDRLVPFSLGWAAREAGEPLERTILRADREMIAVKSSGPPSGLISRRKLS